MDGRLGSAYPNLARPSAYVGLAREAVAGVRHALAYPLGLYPLGLHPRQRPVAAQPETDQQIATALPGHNGGGGGHAPGGRGTPVVLVHGYVHNRSAFLVLGRLLRRAGFPTVCTFSYNPLGRGIAALAGALGTEVERLLSATGATRCSIVGHSMGGLVARSYVQDFGGEHTVDTVITLGTPHRGTYTSYLGVGRALTELRPGSSFLRALDDSARPSDVRWIAYSCDLDVLVTPSTSAALTSPALQATNIRVDATGHLSLLLSTSVLREVTGHLAQPRRGHPQASGAGGTSPGPPAGG